MTAYTDMIKQATAQDGDEQVRAAHIAATIDHLRGLTALDGVTVEDDGVRVLILSGQPARGVTSRAWLEKVAPR